LRPVRPGHDLRDDLLEPAVLARGHPLHHGAELLPLRPNERGVGHFRGARDLALAAREAGPEVALVHIVRAAEVRLQDHLARGKEDVDAVDRTTEGALVALDATLRGEDLEGRIDPCDGCRPQGDLQAHRVCHRATTSRSGLGPSLRIFSTNSFASVAKRDPSEADAASITNRPSPRPRARRTVVTRAISSRA